MQKAVTFIDESQLEERRRRGNDVFDEMWDGVLHMVPPASLSHQSWRDEFAATVRRLLGRREPRPFIAGEVAIADPGRWPKDFRSPDLAIDLECKYASHPEFLTSADLALEVRSPNDETWDKLPFYASREVAEVLVVDRQAGTVELLVLRGGTYLVVQPDPTGWIASQRLSLEMRWDAAARGLWLRRAGDSSGGELVTSPV